MHASVRPGGSRAGHPAVKRIELCGTKRSGSAFVGARNGQFYIACPLTEEPCSGLPIRSAAGGRHDPVSPRSRYSRTGTGGISSNPRDQEFQRHGNGDCNPEGRLDGGRRLRVRARHRSSRGPVHGAGRGGGAGHPAGGLGQRRALLRHRPVLRPHQERAPGGLVPAPAGARRLRPLHQGRPHLQGGFRPSASARSSGARRCRSTSTSTTATTASCAPGRTACSGWGSSASTCC